MKNFILTGAVILAACGAAFAQTTVLVQDPAKPSSKTSVGSSEKTLIDKFALAAARREWKDNDACTEDFSIVGSVEGGFTRKEARQKAVLYEFCQTGNGWSSGGIVLFENGRIAAHYVFDYGGWNLGLTALPDINRNGFEELAILGAGGMHQGYTGHGLTILELTASKVIYWGSTQTYFESCGADKPERPHCEYSFKITAQPGAKPVFFRQKMVESKKRWRSVGKPQKTSLEKASTTYKLLK